MQRKTNLSKSRGLPPFEGENEAGTGAQAHSAVRPGSHADNVSLPRLICVRDCCRGILAVALAGVLGVMVTGCSQQQPPGPSAKQQQEMVDQLESIEKTLQRLSNLASRPPAVKPTVPAPVAPSDELQQEILKKLGSIEEGLRRRMDEVANLSKPAPVAVPAPTSPAQSESRQDDVLNRLERMEGAMQQIALLRRLERIAGTLGQPVPAAPLPGVAAVPPATPIPSVPVVEEVPEPPPAVAVAEPEENVEYNFGKVIDPAATTKPYVTAAAQPVEPILQALGVKQSLIDSRSEWCECLEEDHLAGIWKEARGFVQIEEEKFPALTALPPPPIPPDNLQTLDEKGFPTMDDPKVQLGKLLFFDTRLSGDNSVSCATCHEPDQGWGLNSAISRGYPGTSHWRNSHTVVNSAYMWKLFWDGSAKALEPQAKAANTGLSGNGKTDMMEERLRQCPDYVKMFKEVFGTEIPLLDDAWRAIAAFERVLVQPDTPFDLYMKGDKTALDESQVRGLELFNGKAKCIQCHNGPMFNDQKFYNVGVPQQPSFLEDPIQQITHRFQYYSKGATENIYRNGKIDLGLYFVSKRKGDIGKFRTQTLRYLIYTPPYMHNGVFDTLEEVVDFYNDGGGEDMTHKSYGIANKSKRLKPLNLTDPEKADLVAFLESLSGDELYMDPPVLPALMAFVYRGETYVGLPIPVTSDVDPDERKEPEKVTWTLVEGPKGATIDPESGRITWVNAQPPAETVRTGEDVPILIKIKATNVKDPSNVTEQTLQVTVYNADPPTIESLAGS